MDKGKPFLKAVKDEKGLTNCGKSVDHQWEKKDYEIWLMGEEGMIMRKK